MQHLEPTPDGYFIEDFQVLGLHNKHRVNRLLCAFRCWHFDVTNQVDVDSLHSKELLEVDTTDRGDAFTVVLDIVLIDHSLLCLCEVKNGVSVNMHVVKEPDMNCVFLLTKLDDRVVANEQLVESQAVMLTFDDQVSLTSDNKAFGKLRDAFS